MQRFIIDRFEGDNKEIAVVELPDRSMANIPSRILPLGAVEGDIIELTIDKEESKAKEKRIKKMMEDVWDK